MFTIIGIVVVIGSVVGGFTIAGGQLMGVKLTDRFFLRNASLGASLEVTTPTGIDASANFGFVSIDLGGAANLTAEFSIGLKDPGTGAANNEISLTEFIDAVSDVSTIGTLIDAPSLTGLGQLDLTVGNLSVTRPIVDAKSTALSCYTSIPFSAVGWVSWVNASAQRGRVVTEPRAVATGSYTQPCATSLSAGEIVDCRLGAWIRSLVRQAKLGVSDWVKVPVE